MKTISPARGALRLNGSNNAKSRSSVHYFRSRHAAGGCPTPVLDGLRSSCDTKFL
jgi:hypothetical protein